MKERPGGPQHDLPCHGTNIALTIDDGPDPTHTPLILALLSRYNISATFCMIGARTAANPALVARAAAAGHHLANHTYTHPLNLAALTPAQIHDQISRTFDTLSGLTAGVRPTLFRAPGGGWSPAILAACQGAGLRPLDWSVDPRGWSQPGVHRITQVILTNTRPGAIILNHDGGGNRQQTIDALGIALPRLIDAGYTFRPALTHQRQLVDGTGTAPPAIARMSGRSRGGWGIVQCFGQGRVNGLDQAGIRVRAIKPTRQAPAGRSRTVRPRQSGRGRTRASRR